MRGERVVVSPLAEHRGLCVRTRPSQRRVGGKHRRQRRGHRRWTRGGDIVELLDASMIRGQSNAGEQGYQAPSASLSANPPTNDRGGGSRKPFIGQLGVARRHDLVQKLHILNRQLDRDRSHRRDLIGASHAGHGSTGVLTGQRSFEQEWEPRS